VTLTANADSGWLFDEWSGALSGDVNPETLTMDSDKTVTATFVEEQISSEMGLLLYSHSEPIRTDLFMGENFTIAVYLDPTERIGGWGIYTLEFCQGLANAEYVLPGAEWPLDTFEPGDIDNPLGLIENIQAVLFSMNIDAYPQHNHTACYINFTALDAGECTIRLTSVEIQDANFTGSLPIVTHDLTLTISPRPTMSNNDEETTTGSTTPVSIYTQTSSGGSASSSFSSQKETVTTENEDTPAEETEQDAQDDETTETSSNEDDEKIVDEVEDFSPVETNFEDGDALTTSAITSDTDVSETPLVLLAVPLIAALFVALLLIRKRK